GEVGSESIRNECAILSRYDRQPLLERGQPVHDVIHHDSGFELAGDQNHVLMFAATSVGGLRSNGLVVGLREPCREIDVVAAEILHNSDVCNSRWEGALSPRLNLVDLTEVTVRNALPETDQRRVKPLDV